MEVAQCRRHRNAGRQKPLRLVRRHCQQPLLVEGAAALVCRSRCNVHAAGGRRRCVAGIVAPGGKSRCAGAAGTAAAGSRSTLCGRSRSAAAKRQEMRCTHSAGEHACASHACPGWWTHFAAMVFQRNVCCHSNCAGNTNPGWLGHNHLFARP